MAQEKKKNRFIMPPEMTERLKSTTPDIEKAEHAIETLKGVGMDVSELEDKLDWIKNLKATLLREFTQ